MKGWSYHLLERWHDKEFVINSIQFLELYKIYFKNTLQDVKTHVDLEDTGSQLGSVI